MVETCDPNEARIIAETGWLVECPHGAHGGPLWVALTDEPLRSFQLIENEDYELRKIAYPLRYVKDSIEALRFARKQDAEAFMKKFDPFLLHAVATEHQWITP